MTMFLIVVPRTTQRKTKKKNISSRSDTGLACSEASVQEETGSMLEQKKHKSNNFLNKKVHPMLNVFKTTSIYQCDL